MKVKEVADLVGISVRTLHHYDEIGLLTPEKISASGYRIYSTADLEVLQQILFFRELGFPLKKIKEIITNPSFERQEALELQRKMLLEKRKRLDQMIKTIEKTIQHTKGEIHMSNQEKFAGFDFTHNPYEQEARDRWGDKAVENSVAKLSNMTKNEQHKLSEEMEAIYKKLAALRQGSATSAEAQALIKEWYNFLNSNFGYHYSLEAFKGLGQLYVDDERFTKNIDKYGQGLATFLRDGMAYFADHYTQ